MNDTLMLGGREFHSRFILGSGKYSLKLIAAAVRDAGAELITLAVRRANTREQENILDYIPKGVTLLPNTSGARNAEEAVRIARLARELGCGDFVKIEIMRDSKYLLPDNAETTALGAAYLAGLSTGFWKSTEELAALREGEDRFLPTFDEPMRAARLAAWRQAVSRVRS